MLVLGGVSIFTVVAVVIVLVLILKCIVIVPQSKEYIIERLGVYNTTWEAGLHLKVPIIDRIAKKISMKEQVIDFPPQPVITKDNVTMQIDTVVYYTVKNSKLYTYGVENPLVALQNLTATTLRNIVGDLELDATLTSRETVNTKMKTILDEATDPWGIFVGRVELQNILPPREIQESMEKQMKAERERRAKILEAEGDKESQMTRAEGSANAAVTLAESEKKASILRAEAEKEVKILEATGEAEALIAMQTAKAEGIEIVKKSFGEGEYGCESYLRLESIDAFKSMADGQATKILLPTELQSIASLAVGAKESVSEINLTK